MFYFLMFITQKNNPKQNCEKMVFKFKEGIQLNKNLIEK